MSPRLIADRKQIARYIHVLYKRATTDTFVSLRAFRHKDNKAKIQRPAVKLNGSFEEFIDAAAKMATEVANEPDGWVFAPPVCTLTDSRHARECDLADGLVLSVEADKRPLAARRLLEERLGPATLVMLSGGQWHNPETGADEAKLHLHWRFATPARGKAELALLKAVRDRAAELVGGDTTTVPIVHPLKMAGSWWRKDVDHPRLAIIDSETDCEIDLATAAAQLGVTEGRRKAKFDADKAMENISTGAEYHASTVGLLGRWAYEGVPRDEAEQRLRDLFERAPLHDARWHARYGRISNDAEDIYGKQEAKGRRANIVFDPTNPKRMAREAEAVLLDSGATLYQQAGKLVRVVKLGKPSVVQMVRRPAGAVVLQRANHIWLTGEFMAVARWMKVTKNGEVEPTALPRSVAETYLEMVGEWQVPELVGTVETPTLYRTSDGYELLQTPGYDAASGLYYVPAIDFPEVPLQPSREDAMEAMGKILALLVEFPFVPDDATDDWQPGAEPGAVASASRSVALSMVLTGLIRRGMRAAPMHVFDANSPRTGKSFLVIIISMILIGREPGAVAWVRDENECRKRILAVLLAGDPLFRFDNITQPLGGPALNIMLSEGVFRERLLGKSTMLEALTNCLVAATGNNVEVEADTTGRTVRCRMNARVERPQDRQFKADPLAEATQHRGELVVAGLTILLAYLHAGCPGWNEIKHVAGYEDWSLIRGSLAWLGQPDPADTMLAISDDDPERDEIAQMMFAWEAQYEGRGAVKLTEVISDAQRGGDKYTNHDPKLSNLFDACNQAVKGNKLNATRLGRWFKAHEGQIVGGRRFVRSGDEKHGRKIALLAVGKEAWEDPDLILDAETAEEWET